MRWCIPWLPIVTHSEELVGHFAAKCAHVRQNALLQKSHERMAVRDGSLPSFGIGTSTLLSNEWHCLNRAIKCTLYRETTCTSLVRTSALKSSRQLNCHIGARSYKGRHCINHPLDQLLCTKQPTSHPSTRTNSSGPPTTTMSSRFSGRRGRVTKRVTCPHIG